MLPFLPHATQSSAVNGYLQHIPNYELIHHYSNWYQCFDKDTIQATLQRPACSVWETPEQSCIVRDTAVKNHHTFLLELNLTTETCYEKPVAIWITSALMQRFGFDAERLHHVVTVTHEAIINAVIHGNLNIHRNPIYTHSLDHYYSTIAAHMRYDIFRNKRISVVITLNEQQRLSIRVKDEGSGYPRDVANNPFNAGIGLRTIHSFSDATHVRRNGSDIEMQLFL